MQGGNRARVAQPQGIEIKHHISPAGVISFVDRDKDRLVRTAQDAGGEQDTTEDPLAEPGAPSGIDAQETGIKLAADVSAPSPEPDPEQKRLSRRKIYLAAGLFLGIAFVVQLLGILQTYLGTNIAWTATNGLRGDLAAHCLRLDMSFHKSRTPGELIQRVDGDVAALGNLFSHFLTQIDVPGRYAAESQPDSRVSVCWTSSSRILKKAASCAASFRLNDT